MIIHPSQDISDEFEDEDSEAPEESGDGAVKDFLLSRRGLLVGTLAAAGAAVAGYFALREKGPIGKELMAEYEKITDPVARHMFVLKQVAAGNMPSTWNQFVTVKAKGPKGTEVEFDSAPHGLRIGHDNDYIEVPLDGPHAAAAAEICGYALPTVFMADAIYKQAKSTKGGKVKFFAAPEIAKELGIKNWNNNAPDGTKTMSPEFVRKKNELLKQWRKKNKTTDSQLTSGYFKEIVQPVDGLTGGKSGGRIRRLFGRGKKTKGSNGHLEIYGGYDEQGILIQGVSGGTHEAKFFDYSHLSRIVKPELKVNGKVMSLKEFNASLALSTEFRFNMSDILERPYKYSPELLKFVEDNK